MTGRRGRVLALGGFGLALGFVLGAAGCGDWGEMHRMLTLGFLAGGPSSSDARLMIGYSGGMAVAGVGFFAFARRDAIPPRKLGRTTVIGSVAFGAGWAVCGCCPAVVLVQLGEGRAPALATLLGMLAGTWVCGQAGRRGMRLPSCSGD